MLLCGTHYADVSLRGDTPRFERQDTHAMERRKFLTGAAVATAASTTIAMPAIAQSLPPVSWRLTSSFPKSLDTIYGGGEVFAKTLADITDNQFKVQVFAAGEVVPGLAAADAVQNGTVDACHTASYYFTGKDPTYALACAIPFGLNARQQNSWFHHGGGNDLLNEFFKTQNIHAIPCGNSGAQMGGWFNKEIKTPADLNGLKMRIAGLAGDVARKLGVVPQQIAGGDVYPALERGVIDATEWIGPYDDEKLGFNKIAKFYYYPGFQEGGSAYHLFVNQAKWDALPPVYKAAVSTAASHANLDMLAKYDARNPAAIKRLVASGVQLRPYSPEVLDAFLKAANETYAEISRTNAAFKKIYDQLVVFRNDAYLWAQVAELPFDSFMVRTRPRS